MNEPDHVRGDASELLRAYADSLVTRSPQREMPEIGVAPARLRAYAATLLAAARELPVPSPAAAPSRFVVWRQRAATAMLSVVTVLSANVGVAAAVDGAAPGDFGYALDRGFEVVASAAGIHLDTASERLEEARVLAERGNSEGALRLVNEAMAPIADKPGVRAVVDELAAAFAEVDDSGTVVAVPQHADPVRDAVALLVEAAESVREAARTGGDVTEAAKAMKERAKAVADAARNQNDKGPNDKGPNDRGPGDRGPGDRGPGDRGPGDRGPGGNGAEGKGPNGDGPPGQNQGDGPPGQGDGPPGQDRGDGAASTPPGQSGGRGNGNGPPGDDGG